MNPLKNIDFLQLESTVWIANKPIQVPAYDFSFEPLFHVNRPRINHNVTVTGRFGAIPDYLATYNSFANIGFDLINSPEQHLLASELEHWYPKIESLTPMSKVYDVFPSLEEVCTHFSFPIFIKGNRQTAKHNPELAIAKNEADYKRIKQAYAENAILHWQKVVIREFVPLQPLVQKVNDKVQLSYEFRTFWWKNELVGSGHYWSQYLQYSWTPDEQQNALQLAKKAVDTLNVPFIAIDLALTADQHWIIIECNDAQESGYCGVNPLQLWKNIVSLEKQKKVT